MLRWSCTSRDLLLSFLIERRRFTCPKAIRFSEHRNRTVISSDITLVDSLSLLLASQIVYRLHGSSAAALSATAEGPSAEGGLTTTVASSVSEDAAASSRHWRVYAVIWICRVIVQKFVTLLTTSVSVVVAKAAVARLASLVFTRLGSTRCGTVSWNQILHFLQTSLFWKLKLEHWNCFPTNLPFQSSNSWCQMQKSGYFIKWHAGNRVSDKC